MKNYILILLLLIVSGAVFSQCNYKITNRPDGNVMHYYNPQPVVKQEKVEIGIGIYKNITSGDCFLNVSVLFKKGTPQELAGLAIIQTNSNEGISLPIEVSELVEMNGRDLAIGLYKLSDRDLNILRKYTLKSIFVNVGINLTGANTTMNKDIILNQLKCL